MSKIWVNRGKGGSVIDTIAAGTSRARIFNGGLQLPGSFDNYASSPDSVPLSITGDIDIKVKVAMTDWTPAADTSIVAKSTSSGNQISYRLMVNTLGRIVIVVSPDGTSPSEVSMNSTVSTGVTDGATKWIRATLDVNDGASNRVAKFYTSDNGTTWTQLGTTVTTAGVTSIFDGTAVLETGARNVGQSSLLAGTVYRVIIQSAYDTTNNTTSLVYDANFENVIADTLTFTESSPNAAIVTINPSIGTGDPLLLKPEDSGYVYLTGSTSYISTPDSIPLSITGDIDIKTKIALDNWQSGGYVVSKSDASTQQSYELSINAIGTITLTWSASGTISVTRTSTSSINFINGDINWIRATMDVDNGSGSHVVKFYTSSNGDIWNQLGTTVTTAGVTSIYNATTALNIGRRASGTNNITGKVYRVIIQSSYDTANNNDNVVFDMNCDAINSHGQITFIEQSSNNAVVTINRSTGTGVRKTVSMPSINKKGTSVWLFGTDDFFQTSDNSLLDIHNTESATIFIVHRHWTDYGFSSTPVISKRANNSFQTSGYRLGLGTLTPDITGNGIIDNGLKLANSSIQYAYSSDSTALSITGDIDIKAKLSMPDWTPSVTNWIVNKRSDFGTNRSYSFRVNTNGTLSFLQSSNGTSDNIHTSTVATGFADNATRWIRATMDVNDGSGNRVVKFYTSVDGTTWTQLGTTITTAGTTSIYDSTMDLTVGITFNITTGTTATIQRVIIQSGYDNADNTTNLRFDADFDAQDIDAVGFYESSANQALVIVTGCYPYTDTASVSIGDGTDGNMRYSNTITSGALNTTACVINRQNNTMNLYLNGSSRNTANIANIGDTSNSTDFLIGRVSTSYLAGEVYAVILWKKALTVDEINKISDYYRSLIP